MSPKSLAKSIFIKRNKQSLIDYHQVMINENKYTALNIEELWENFSSTLNGPTSKQSSIGITFLGSIRTSKIDQKEK